MLQLVIVGRTWGGSREGGGGGGRGEGKKVSWMGTFMVMNVVIWAE